MFDISGQLFPNIITLLVQLCATAVIFVLYRKFLHEPVLKILDKKADAFQKSYQEIETLKEEQIQVKALFEQDKIKQQELLEQTKQHMLDELAQMRATLLEQMEREVTQMKQTAEEELAQEKLKMLADVEQHVVTVAATLTSKVLEGYTFDESQIVHTLEREMAKIYAHS